MSYRRELERHNEHLTNLYYTAGDAVFLLIDFITEHDINLVDKLEEFISKDWEMVDSEDYTLRYDAIGEIIDDLKLHTDKGVTEKQIEKLKRCQQSCACLD